MIIQTPPMGWNSWNTFGEDINEKMIFETADAMVNTGLKDCGYDYLVIDDCWSKRVRDENGKLEADPVKFPHGMKYVADYVHSKGLKFGMYSCSGAVTCASYPGSYQHEFTDAATFASWDVDYLKYDFCFRDNNVPAEILYRRMGLALANCGRDILFAACNFGQDHTETWIRTTGAGLWRSTGDLFHSWGSILKRVGQQLEKTTHGGRGCFNDLDMLVVGMNGKGNVAQGELTFEEYKTHFSFWSIFSSPLMIGCDVRNMNEETKKILTNRDVIAIAQDPGAYQVAVKKSDPLGQMLAYRMLANGDIALGVFNFGDEAGSKWSGWILPEDWGWTPESGTKLVAKDLWDGTETEIRNDVFIEEGLEPHCCKLYRVSMVKK